MSKTVAERKRVYFRPTDERRELLENLSFERKVPIQAIVERALDDYLEGIESRDELTQLQQAQVERFVEFIRSARPHEIKHVLGGIEILMERHKAP